MEGSLKNWKNMEKNYRADEEKVGIGIDNRNYMLVIDIVYLNNNLIEDNLDGMNGIG